MRTTTPDRCVTRDTPGPDLDTRAWPRRGPLTALLCAVTLALAAWGQRSARAQSTTSEHEREFMPARIRVGLPAGTRHHLLFACDPVRPATSFRGHAYAVDTLGASHFVLRRLPSDAPVFGAPETLDVRLFSDVADQEIALERDELDVAVFWPGERSARIRDDERWANAARGTRPHGALVAIAAGRDSLRRVPARDLRLVNRMVWSGDLVAWPGTASDSSEAPTRYTVDPRLPGAKLLERVLGRLATAGARRTVRIAYVDEATLDSAGTAWRGAGVQPVFAIGHPVLFAGALAHRFLDAPAADDWAALLACPGETR